MIRRFGHELTNLPQTRPPLKARPVPVPSALQLCPPHLPDILLHCSTRWRPSASSRPRGTAWPVLASWLYGKVVELALKWNTLFKAVQLLARTLTKGDFQDQKLSLLAAASLHIAVKLQQTYNSPSAQSYLDATSTATVSQVVEHQREILLLLQYQVCSWTSYDFMLVLLQHCELSQPERQLVFNSLLKSITEWLPSEENPATVAVAAVAQARLDLLPMLCECAKVGRQSAERVAKRLLLLSLSAL